MNRFAKQLAIGIVCALGLGVGPVLAGGDGSGNGNENAKASGNRGHDTMSTSHGAALPACPVADEPINFSVSTPTDEGPVFFCCAGCIPKYKADPAKYATKVAAQRKALAKRPKIQVTCPVSGEPVDQDIFIDAGGKKVYFCCEGCRGKYKRNAKKYASALANSYTYQTKCPVTDEKIDPAAFTETASGANIYFCCKGCDKKFFKNPKKYAPSLVAQGFTFDAKDMTPAMEGHSDHGDDDDHDHGH